MGDKRKTEESPEKSAKKLKKMDEPDSVVRNLVAQQQRQEDMLKAYQNAQQQMFGMLESLKAQLSSPPMLRPAMLISTSPATHPAEVTSSSSTCFPQEQLIVLPNSASEKRDDIHIPLEATAVEGDKSISDSVNVEQALPLEKQASILEEKTENPKPEAQAVDGRGESDTSQSDAPKSWAELSTPLVKDDVTNHDAPSSITELVESSIETVNEPRSEQIGDPQVQEAPAQPGPESTANDSDCEVRLPQEQPQAHLGLKYTNPLAEQTHKTQPAQPLPNSALPSQQESPAPRQQSPPRLIATAEECKDLANIPILSPSPLLKNKKVGEEQEESQALEDIRDRSQTESGSAPQQLDMEDSASRLPVVNSSCPSKKDVAEGPNDVGKSVATEETTVSESQVIQPTTETKEHDTSLALQDKSSSESSPAENSEESWKTVRSKDEERPKQPRQHEEIKLSILQTYAEKAAHKPEDLYPTPAELKGTLQSHWRQEKKMHFLEEIARRYNVIKKHSPQVVAQCATLEMSSSSLSSSGIVQNGQAMPSQPTGYISSSAQAQKSATSSPQGSVTASTTSQTRSTMNSVTPSKMLLDANITAGCTPAAIPLGGQSPQKSDSTPSSNCSMMSRKSSTRPSRARKSGRSPQSSDMDVEVTQQAVRTKTVRKAGERVKSSIARSSSNEVVNPEEFKVRLNDVNPNNNHHENPHFLFYQKGGDLTPNRYTRKRAFYNYYDQVAMSSGESSSADSTSDEEENEIVKRSFTLSDSPGRNATPVSRYHMATHHKDSGIMPYRLCDLSKLPESTPNPHTVPAGI